jgi:hypothetical protein
MRNHLFEYGLLYAAAALFLLMIGIVISAADAEQTNVNACFDRGMVLVDTPAGNRCAAIHLLEPVR